MISSGKRLGKLDPLLSQWLLSIWNLKIRFDLGGGGTIRLASDLDRVSSEENLGQLAGLYLDSTSARIKSYLLDSFVRQRMCHSIGFKLNSDCLSVGSEFRSIVAESLVRIYIGSIFKTTETRHGSTRKTRLQREFH